MLTNRQETDILIQILINNIKKEVEYGCKMRVNWKRETVWTQCESIFTAHKKSFQAQPPKENFYS